MTHFLPVGTSLGRLHIEEVYDAFDGPRLFSAASATGATYLAFWIDEHESSEDWLYVAVSRRRLDEIVEGAIALREAFTRPEEGVVFHVKTHFDGSKGPQAQPKTPEEVDPAALPLADDRLSGRRLQPAHVTLASPNVPQALLNGRVQQRLKLEGRGGRPVPFDAVTAALSKWQRLFTSTFSAVGGAGQLIPVAAEPGSFKLTLTLQKGRAATIAFGHVRDFVDSLEAGEDVELDPRAAKLDAREFDALVSTLREYELKLTIEQDSASNAPLDPVVLDLREPSPIERLAQDNASQFLDSIEIPQADDLDRVLRLVDLMANHTRVTSENLDVVPRQVAYYKQACRVLRLLDDDNELTPVGRQVICLQDRKARLAALAVQFETSRCGWRWVEWSQGQSLLDVDIGSAEEFLDSEATALSASTARRRARTLATWCGMLQPEHFLGYIRRSADLAASALT